MWLKTGGKRGKKKGKEKGGGRKQNKENVSTYLFKFTQSQFIYFLYKMFLCLQFFFFFILTFDSITKIFFIYFIRSKDKTKKRYQITNASSLSKKINSFIYIYQ